MGDDLQTAVAAIAVAIAIPLIIAGMVRACGVSPHRPFQTMVPRDRRRLNATVHLVPLSGVSVRQVNHGWEGAQVHRPQAHHHLPPAHSVGSLRDPPPAYPAHHLDAQFDGVVHRYGNISNAGDAVDAVPVPLPPSYGTVNANGSHQPL